jgi:hypothetical protein
MQYINLFLETSVVYTIYRYFVYLFFGNKDIETYVAQSLVFCVIFLSTMFIFIFILFIFFSFFVSAQYLKNEMSDLNETWYTYA